MSHGEQGAGSGSISAAADTVARRLGALEPRVAIVLGSGLGSVADAVQSAIRIPLSAIPGFPKPAAPGHKGELVAGTLEGVPVLVQSGRFHLYEGHAPQVAALPVRVFARLGIRTLILSNAAGGIRSTFRPPTLMLIADHINLMFRNPLEGALEEGVYAALLGPSYETPAEIRMLARLGADAVGMSTVPEVIVARARGIRCLGFSSITNVAAGLSAEPLSHEEVLAAGSRVAGQLGALLSGVVGRLAHA